MKHKVYHNEYLQQLLLSTGNAILIDSACGDALWTCGATEVELQRLLTKSYVTPEKLVSWMLGNGAEGKTPKNVSHLYGNKSGLLLMELREKMAVHTSSRIPLVRTEEPFSLFLHTFLDFFYIFFNFTSSCEDRLFHTFNQFFSRVSTKILKNVHILLIYRRIYLRLIRFLNFPLFCSIPL